ncbi:MAG: site-specific integrase [Lachnospiraceae bacterium]|nr:site-specific integrase [Lachnospiraceae bacterium]
MSRRTKGSGYVRKNADGTKTLIVTLQDPLNRRQKKVQATAKTETACWDLIKIKKEAFLSESASAPAEMPTVTDLCKRFLAYKFEQGLIKPSSRDRDFCTINNHIENTKLGNMHIDKVTVASLDDHFTMFFSEKRLSASSIAKVKHILNAAFQWAFLRQEIPSNPMLLIVRSIDNRLDALAVKTANDMDVRILSPVMIAKLQHEAGRKCKYGQYLYPQGLCILLLLETGMRVGELIALRWSDYNAETGILSIGRGRVRVREDNACDAGISELEYKFLEDSTKNQKARNIQLTSAARSLMDDIRQAAIGGCSPDDYICSTRKGTPLSSSDMDSRIATIFRNAGIAKEDASGLHILRRTFATQKYRVGWDTAKIAAYLGDLESTVKKYYIADRDIRDCNGKQVAVICIPQEEI